MDHNGCSELPEDSGGTNSEMKNPGITQKQLEWSDEQFLDLWPTSLDEDESTSENPDVLILEDTKDQNPKTKVVNQTLWLSFLKDIMGVDQRSIFIYGWYLLILYDNPIIIVSAIG